MSEPSDRKIAEKLAARRTAAQIMQHRTTAVSIAAVVIIAGLIMTLSWVLLRRQSSEVSGVVRCMSGAPVQGIYVKEEYRGTGSFAIPTREPTNPSIARFEAQVRGSRQYGVNIGCGPLGAPKWTEEPRSGYQTLGHYEFNCHDEPGDRLYGTCVRVR